MPQASVRVALATHDDLLVIHDSYFSPIEYYSVVGIAQIAH
jgi:hypothetical protein